MARHSALLQAPETPRAMNAPLSPSAPIDRLQAKVGARANSPRKIETIISLVIGFSLVSEARDNQDELIWRVSHADHESALLATAGLRHAEGLAYFDRALAYRPQNIAALAASAVSMYGVHRPSWRNRSVAALSGQVKILMFSEEGRHLAVVTELPGASPWDGVGYEASVLDAATGGVLGKTKLEHFPDALHFTSDGRCLLDSHQWKRWSVMDVVSGSEVATGELEPAVNSMMFSADRRLVATGMSGSGDAEREVRVAAADTGKVISRAPFEGDVELLGFSPEGRCLLVKERYVIHVVDTQAGGKVAQVEGERARFSPDGQHFATWRGTGRDEDHVRVCETATGRELSKTTLPAAVWTLRFSPDGVQVAVGTGDERNDTGEVRIIAALTGQEVSRVRWEHSVHTVRFSPDGLLLAVGSHEHASIMHCKSGARQPAVHFAAGLATLDFSPDGRYLAAGAMDGTVRILEPGSRSYLTWTSSRGLVLDSSFSPDSHYLATADYDERSVRVIDLANGKESGRIELGTAPNSVCFNADGHQIAVGCSDGSVWLIEMTTWKVSTIVKLEREVGPVCFSPDGRRLAVISDDRTARVIDLASRREILRKIYGGAPSAVCFSPDGRYLACGGLDESLHVVDLATAADVSTVEFKECVNSIAFSPDGRCVVVGCGPHIDSFGVEVRRRGEAVVVETLTGREISRFTADKAVRVVAFSPDGCSVIAGGFDNAAHVIASATGKEVSRVEFKDAVSSVAFSPDGRFAAAGSLDGTAVVFDAGSGREICRLSNMNREDGVQSIQFSPDGRYLATTGGNSKNLDGVVTVVDCFWSDLKDEASAAWHSALRVQSGARFADNGRLVRLSADALVEAQQEVDAFLRAGPKPSERWQHDILRWSRMAPDRRPTTANSGKPFCVAMGHRLMRITPMTVGPDIEAWAGDAPWHPLMPVSLARLEATSIVQTDPAARATKVARARFLARLTLNRLLGADEKLYGREALAEYAAWAANVMHGELHLNPEALQALTFAWECTPPEKQNALQELKVRLAP